MYRKITFSLQSFKGKYQVYRIVYEQRKQTKLSNRIILLINFEVSTSQLSSDSTYTGLERSMNNLGMVKHLVLLIFGFMWWQDISMTVSYLYMTVYLVWNTSLKIQSGITHLFVEQKIDYLNGTYLQSYRDRRGNGTS